MLAPQVQGCPPNRSRCRSPPASGRALGHYIPSAGSRGALESTKGGGLRLGREGGQRPPLKAHGAHREDIKKLKARATPHREGQGPGPSWRRPTPSHVAVVWLAGLLARGPGRFWQAPPARASIAVLALRSLLEPLLNFNKRPSPLRHACSCPVASRSGRCRRCAHAPRFPFRQATPVPPRGRCRGRGG